MHYTFKLRTVTEVYAGGADIQDSELRPSAFRGPLRFWFRAMMGKVVGNDLERLKHLETLAFGATEANSPFKLRLADCPEFVEPGTLIDPIPSVGKTYLAFSLYDRVDRQMQLARGCIPAGRNFTLTLRFCRPDQRLQEVLLGSLWLLLNFGGIGSRTRRGFGSLAVRSVELDKNAIFNYFSPDRTGASIQQFYRIGYRLAEQRFTDFAAQSVNIPSDETAEYPNFSNWAARVIVRANTPIGIQATEHWFSQWGIILRSFRNDTRVAPGQADALQQLRYTTPDYQEVISRSMDGEEPNRSYLQNDVMGLPIVVQSGTRGGIKMTISWGMPGKEKDGRRSSPLFLHPVLLSDGRLATLVTFFISRFLPDGAEIPIHCPSGNPLETAMDTDIQKTSEEFFEYLDEILNPRPGRIGDLLVSLPEFIAGNGN